MKLYAHLRIENFKLHQDVKVRAAKEGKTTIELVEQALKDYLKKPLQKSGA